MSHENVALLDYIDAEVSEDEATLFMDTTDTLHHSAIDESTERDMETMTEEEATAEMDGESHSSGSDVFTCVHSSVSTSWGVSVPVKAKISLSAETQTELMMELRVDARSPPVPLTPPPSTAPSEYNVQVPATSSSAVVVDEVTEDEDDVPVYEDMPPEEGSEGTCASTVDEMATHHDKGTSPMTMPRHEHTSFEACGCLDLFASGTSCACLHTALARNCFLASDTVWLWLNIFEETWTAATIVENAWLTSITCLWLWCVCFPTWLLMLVVYYWQDVLDGEDAESEDAVHFKPLIALFTKIYALRNLLTCIVMFMASFLHLYVHGPYWKLLTWLGSCPYYLVGAYIFRHAFEEG